MLHITELSDLCPAATEQGAQLAKTALVKRLDIMFKFCDLTTRLKQCGYDEIWHNLSSPQHHTITAVFKEQLLA